MLVQRKLRPYAWFHFYNTLSGLQFQSFNLTRPCIFLVYFEPKTSYMCGMIRYIPKVLVKSIWNRGVFEFNMT